LNGVVRDGGDDVLADMQRLKNLGTALRKGFRTVMPTCRQASQLQSEALDHELSHAKRFGLRLHLLLCRWCRRYGEQIRALREAAHEHPDKFTEAAPNTLSAEGRERLRRSLKNEGE
jgi:hypothetical protein